MNAGTVRLHRGNADYLFPYSESARRHKLEGLLQDTPFLADTLIFSLPEPPTFLGAGDFDGDGHKDLVAAQRGGHQLWFLAGSGDGFFDSPAPIRLEGMVSGLAVGEVGRADGLEDIVVCVDGEGGPQLRIFQHDLGALDGETRSILLPEVAAVVRIGRLDPRSAPHIAVISGGRLGLLSTEAERIQRASDEGYVAFDWYTFDTPALSLALGDFAGESETELAVLCSGGVVEVLRQIEGGMEVAGARSLLPSQSWDGARLMRTRTSTHRKDDLLIVDAARGSLHLLVGDKVDTRVLDASGGSVMVRLAATHTTTAALPLRANRDALDDLVFVERGSTAPMAITTQGGGFTVDSAADDPDVNKGDDKCVTAAGKCTLRAAIEEANAKPDKNVISFAPSITSIQPAGLPATMHPVDIEGGETRVEIDAGFGLRIDGGSSTLSRLIVNGSLTSTPILLRNGNGNTVKDCWVGIDRAGNAKGNSVGIQVESSNHTIGGTAKEARNILSGNGGPGITIFGGVSVFGEGADNNKIQGNYIGTSVDGKTAVPNGEVSLQRGVRLTESTNTVIGGLEAGAGNLISGNAGAGVFASGDTNVRIQGNRIGIDSAMNPPDFLGNSGCGIVLSPAFQSQIGGTTEASANTISGNRDCGIQLNGITENTRIWGNYIGTNKDGNNLANKSDGIRVFGPSHNQIGGDAKVKGNRIWFNSGVGVLVCTFQNEGNSILYNSIDSNGELGIDLSKVFTCRSDGVTGNDDDDMDTGPNQLQNFPELISADADAIRGILPGYEDTGTSEFSNCVVLAQDSDGNGCADDDEKPGEENDPTKCTTTTGLGTTISIEVDEATAEAIIAAIFLGTLVDQDAVLPVGFQDWVIQLKEAGAPSVLGVEPEPQATTVTLFLPPDVKVDSYFNFGPTPDNPEPHYYEFLFDGTTGAEILEDRIVLHFVDGARGDHDLTVNGEIVTRGGPVTNASLLLFPFNRTVAGSFTGFTVSNFSQRNALVEMDAFDSEGDLSLFSNNPTVFGVSASNQLARLGAQIFEADESTDAVSWVRAKTDNPELGSFFQIGGGARLDGSVAFTEQSKMMYFTRVFEGPTSFRGQPASTLLSIANPNSEEITVKLTLLGNPEGGSPAGWIEPSGALAPVQIRTIAPRGALFATVSEIFEEELNVASAFIEVEVTEGEGAVGFELIELQSQDTVIGLNASFGSTQTESFSAQLASIPGSVFTNLKVLNTSEENRSLTLTAVAEDGGDLAAPVQMNLVAGEFLEQDAGEVFAFDGNAVGSLRIVADGEGVIGDIIFGDPVGFNFAASLPLQTETFTEAVFSQVADLPGLFFTGLAFYNPGVLDAEVTIEIISANGELVGQATRTLEAGKRLSELTSQLVPDSAGQAGGYVLIRSDQPLIAQIIFGGLGPGGITLFSAVPPTVIQ